MILQDDRFDATDSVTVCAFTSDPEPAFLIRVAVEPTAANGLDTLSWIMADKISTIPKSRLGRRIGILEDGALARMERAVLVFLGITGSVESASAAEPTSEGDS